MNFSDFLQKVKKNDMQRSDRPTKTPSSPNLQFSKEAQIQQWQSRPQRTSDLPRRKNAI